MRNVTVLLLWALLCAVQSAAAWAGGSLSDRLRKTSVVAVTWLAYGVGLICIAAAHGLVDLWVAVVAYAGLSGMGEGAEKALIGDLANVSDRGTMFGWYSMIVGLAAIPAAVLFGTIWARLDAGTAFTLFGGLAIFSAALVRRHNV